MIRHPALAVLAVAAAALIAPIVPALDGEAENELHERMEKIEDSMRFLRRSLRKPEQDQETLRVLQEAESEALVCKTLVPTRAAGEADRDAFLVAFRSDMCSFIQQLLEVERAVLAGDHEKAQELYKDIKRFEKSSHEKYQEPEEDDGR